MMYLWGFEHLTGNKAIPFCHVPVMELVFAVAVKRHLKGCSLMKTL